MAMMPSSRLRSQSEYSLCSAETGVRAPDIGHARLGQTEIAHFAFPHEFADRAGNIFHGHRAVDPMLVKQIDVIGLQPPERPFDRRANRRGTAVGVGEHLFAVLEFETELGGNDDLGPDALQGPADERLIVVGAVYFGGVEKVAADVDRTLQRSNRLGFIGRAVGLTHGHAANTDARHRQTLIAELALRLAHR